MKRQLTYYYIYWALVGTWFATGIWVFFSRKYLSISNIGIIDALAFGIGLLANIPTGALADKFGRRKMVILGVSLAGVGFTIWGLATTGWMVFTGMLIYSIGISLQSGADDAMMYEYLKSHGHENMWTKVTTNTNIISRVSFVISIFIGGIAYEYLDRLPFLLRGFTFFLMLIPLYKLAIVDRFQPIHKTTDIVGGYWHNLKSGVHELFKIKIAWVVPIYLLVQGISYAVFTAGLLRPILYEHTGLTIKYISPAISLALALTVIVLIIAKKFESKMYIPKTIFIFATICAIGFAVNVGHSLIISLTGLTILQIATYILMPMLSNQVNKAIDSRHRATTLSTASFLESAVYVIAAPIVGLLTGYKMINQIVIGAVILIIMGLVVSLLIYKRSGKISLPLQG